MTLSPQLDTIEALYRKLEREAVRAFHHPNLTHKSDHFYNFCITAHSMRDYLFERIGKIKDADRQPFIDTWKQDPNLVAIADIANSAKHFRLRTRSGLLKDPKTRRVSHATTSMFDVFLGPSGSLTVQERTSVRTIAVTLEDGRRLEMYQFMYSVLEYWRGMLVSNGIKVRRQSWASLHGRDA